uniref:MEIS N-terminal domain-containing protein n=1 Tax=Loxodonta africana TaxID=9785 RepID=G3U381_LOXAF
MPPQYNELPHYPSIVDGPAALAGFSEATRAPGPYGPHRAPQPPPPGLDSDSLKREKDEIYGHPLFPLRPLGNVVCRGRVGNGTEGKRQVTGHTYYCITPQLTSLVMDPFSILIPLASLSLSLLLNLMPSVFLIMIQAIQVLRFHLLELEKVHDLCDNFCHRYITCLKGKMPIDLVIEDRDIGCREDLEDYPASCPSLPDQNNTWIRDHEDSGSVHLGTPGPSSGGLASQSGDNSSDQGDGLDTSVASPSSGGEDEELDQERRRNKKRGIFPKVATNIMRAWLFQHLSGEFRSNSLKKHSARRTQTLLLRVFNSFNSFNGRLNQSKTDRKGETAQTVFLRYLGEGEAEAQRERITVVDFPGSMRMSLNLEGEWHYL